MSRLQGLGLDISVVLVGLIVSVLFVSILVNIPLVRDNFFPEQAAATVEEVEYPGTTDIYQIEIKNGVGISGVAEQMRTYLRSKGYDVVGVGNYGSFDVEQTIVVDRIGDLSIARQVAASLGLPSDRIRQELRSEFQLDASVILGKDYGIIPPFTDMNSPQ